MKPSIIGRKAAPELKVSDGKIWVQTASSGMPQICVQAGPRGPMGPSGAAPSIDVILTGQNALSGHRAVVLEAGSGMRYADPLSDIDANAQIGILVQATSPGNPGRVQLGGQLDDPSFNFVNGPVFLGQDGALVQIPPTHGWIRVIARAISPVTIIIDPEIPFWRE
jgi:hypothetical protein